MKVALLVLLLMSTSAHGGSLPFHFKKNGKLPSGTTYEIEIQERPYVQRPGDLPDDGSTWGIDGGFCSNAVKTFRVKINNEVVPVNRKYYTDICDLRTAMVSEEKGKLILSIAGGDGAGAFTARYAFVGNKLTQRVTRMTEMPDQYWEWITLHNDL